MTSSLEFYLSQVNAPKVCIAFVSVLISSLCMTLMLSIKCFAFFAQILRFSINWRTHLQNDVSFGILFCVRSMPLRFVLHLFFFYKFLVFGLNVIDQILCLFCWNFKIFHKLTYTSPKWRHLWNFICVRSIPLRFVLHPFLFV